MSVIKIYETLEDKFPNFQIPGWYEKAIRYLRGGSDRGLFGLYLYNLIKSNKNIKKVVNIGTARGHSTVCMAKAMNKGKVHTIDVLPPDKPRNWHSPSHFDNDPLKDRQISMQEIIGMFVSETSDVKIEFHAGDSNEVLKKLDLQDVDLVFHDGRHHYKDVWHDVKKIEDFPRRNNNPAIQVFDDCYLFNRDWEWSPFSHEIWYTSFAKKSLYKLIHPLQKYTFSKREYPGINKAVKKCWETGKWETMETISDVEHAPITTLFPN